jgi:hypothetical protein
MTEKNPLDIWEASQASGHRRISRRPEVLAALAELVRRDSRLEILVTKPRADLQDWSATGVHDTGTWHATGESVFLKLGVTDAELFWTRWLTSHAPDLVPTLLASGDQLGPSPGRDVGWIVTEKLPYGLDPSWQGNEFAMLLEAGVRFQEAAREAPAERCRVIDQAEVRGRLERGLAHAPPGPARQLVDRFYRDWEWVVAVCPPEVCHGDLHLANALARVPPPAVSPAVLIDPAPALQLWAFDAARAQLLNSIDRRRPGYTHLVERMAAPWETYGLPTCRGTDLSRLAAISLGWFAIIVWGRVPQRHSVPEYIFETQRYLEESVSV